MNTTVDFRDPTEGKTYRYHFDRAHFSTPRSFGKVDLYQIGRLYCNPEDSIALHPNLTVLELTAVTGGVGTVEINGKTIPVKRGDIQLTFPGDLHAIFSDAKNPLEYDFCALWSSEPALHSLLEQTVQLCKAAGVSVIRDERIRDLIGVAIGELSGEDEWSNAALEGIFLQILSLIFRNVHRGAGSKALTVAAADELCYRMRNYIDTHIYSMKNLSEMADAMNYNYSYLSELFRAVTGGTLQEYHRDRKMERACLLIREGGHSLEQIAELLQYSSIYTFNRAFRDRYGMPPGAYRRAARG